MTICELYKKDVEETAKGIPSKELLQGKSLLITGCTGLIGSAVADILLSLSDTYGIKIHLAGRSEARVRARFPQEGYDFISYDATKPFETTGIYDYIIHAASNAGPRMISTQPVETMLSNILGTLYLLNHLKKQGSGRLVLISSSEVYGNKPGNEPHKENEYGSVDILNPRASYPSSKRTAETLCASFHAEYGTDFVAIRPGHIYGPTMTATDSRASSQFPRDIVEGHDIVMKSPGNQLRSYCHCLDYATAILTIMLRGETGTAYNVSNPDSVVTIRQMAEAFAKAGGKHVVFDLPTETERAGYNLMTNSSLNASRLLELGRY